MTSGHAARQSSSQSPSGRSPGELRDAISNAIVAMFKEHYGLGPAASRTVIDEDLVVVIMRGGMTANELTLIEHGHEEAVRTYRLCFQGTMAPKTSRIVAELTGREVLTHHSQVLFDPHTTIELFVMDAPVLTGD